MADDLGQPKLGRSAHLRHYLFLSRSLGRPGLPTATSLRNLHALSRLQCNPPHPLVPDPLSFFWPG